MNLELDLIKHYWQVLGRVEMSRHLPNPQSPDVSQLLPEEL